MESQATFSREKPEAIETMMNESEENVGKHVREKTTHLRHIYIYICNIGRDYNSFYHEQLIFDLMGSTYEWN